MTRFIRLLFHVSDAFAAVLLGVGLLCVAAALLALIAGVAPREADELGTTTLLLSGVAWGVVAGGAYMLLRRKVPGDLLVSILVVRAFEFEDRAVALAVFGLVLIVFLLPFALVLLQAHRSIRSTPSGAK